MEPRLSIIIPFYNVEQYIAQCLDSVYNQDIPEEEYEVICVNDASPDNSREIVKEYQKKHKNLILVEHEVNKKLGAARNTGRSVAKGKYIWNVDSDDMIAPNCLKEMLEICEKNELDVLLFGCKRLHNDQLYERKEAPWDESLLLTTGLMFWKEQGIKKQGQISAVWTQIYRRDYLDNNHIFSPEINMGEDVPYTYSSILHAKCIKAINTPYYIYRDNSESLTGALRKHPNPKAIYENSFVCSAYLFSLIKQIPSDEQLVINAFYAVTRHIVLLFPYHGNLLSPEERKILLSLCRRHFVKNLFVYKVLTSRQAFKYTKYIITGILPEKC